MPPIPHYIFGYGSLICPRSRALTAPTLAQRPATPVRVQGLERIWSLPWKGLTFMGIRQRPQAECVGVLIHVNDDELAQLDLRELGYDRVLIPIDQVQELQEPSMMPLQANIWVYVQQSPQAVSKESPIAQSYVDIILRGCFSISEDFARDFLKTTRGWHLYDHDDNENDDKGPREGNEHSVHWVDDRENPLYVRADKEYSQANAHYLDRILKEHRPEWIHRRRM